MEHYYIFNRGKPPYLYINRVPTSDYPKDKSIPDIFFTKKQVDAIPKHATHGFYTQKIIGADLVNLSTDEINERISNERLKKVDRVLQERQLEIQKGFIYQNKMFDFDRDIYERVLSASKVTPYTEIDLFTKDGNVFSLDTKAKAKAWLKAYETARNKIEDDCIAERKKIT